MKQILIATALLAASVAACSPSTPSAPSTDTALPTSAPTPAAENVHRFQIGTLNAISLRDGSLSVPNDGHSFIVDHSVQDVSALLSAANLPTDQISFSIEPLYVDAGAHKLLFDTGLGTSSPTGGQLGASMTAASIDPSSITDIFISHAHGDHMDGLLNATGALAFPNAAIHITTAEWAHLRAMSADDGKLRGIPDVRALVTAMTPKVATFAPGATLIPNVVTAVDIKGHTPGHSGYQIGTGDQSLLYIGDSMHHYVLSVARPAWHNSFDENPTLAATSRQALVTRLAQSHQRIYASHFPFPGIGHVETHGSDTVWVGE